MSRNKKKYKAVRVAASLMSALMVTSMYPSIGYIGALSPITAVAATTDTKESKLTWTSQDLLATVGVDSDSNLVLRGEGWSSNTATDDKTFADGFSAIGENAKAGSAKASTNGKNATGTIPDGGCYLEYKATAKGSVCIDAKIGKGKTFYVVDSDGNIATKFENTGTSSAFESVEFSVEEGKTYYAYLAGATAQIWQVTYNPVSDAKQTPWDEVEAPYVTGIDEDGMDLVVNFEGTVDKLVGADNLQVTLYYESNDTYYEVDTVAIKNNTTKSARFTPLWSGNYKAVVAAQRSGEAVKYSNEFIKTGYVLAVKQPVIESVISNGDGTVSVDWMNLEDADSYELLAKSADSSDYVSLVKTENANAKVSLPAGNYDFKVLATRNSDGYVAEYVKSGVEVKDTEFRTWNIATIGSAQETNAVITDKNGDVTSINISSKDEAETKIGHVGNVCDVSNTTGNIEIKGASNGKISDGEEGFQYYYTTVNPNEENFELSANFEITDTSLTPDNQTGFGIIACDMAGYNFFGAPDYVHKYFNSVSTQMYSSKGQFIGQRIITGYSSTDTTSYDGVTRNTIQNKANGEKVDFSVGKTYNFTLKKTNDAWESYVNGVKLSNSDLSCLSVQEDGSITVGVFVARKVSVKISDIKFTTTSSTGVGQGKEAEKINPSARVYSTNISAVKDYEFIYSPTVSGNVKVFNVDGSVAYEGHLNANEVLRTIVTLTGASNPIKYEFTPDANQNLTSYDVLQGQITVNYKTVGNVNDILYVSPEGKSSAAGTKDDPLDVQTAVNYAQPGQYILLLNGSYKGNQLKIARSNSGTKDAHIKLVAETPNKVIFEGMGISLTGCYWDIYGIYVHKPSAVGIQIGGNYNTIEMCTVEGSGNTGIQISRNDGAEREAGMSGLLWPSYNLVKNCESFDNCDSGRNDADGFAAKLTSGVGNVFYGCIGHNNIDDGWDLFAKTISGEIGMVQIINCVAYNNGWLTTDDTTAPGYVFGEGNGFKLGGSYMKGGHELINSVTFANNGKGITSNSCPDCKVFNCTSYGNALGDDSYYNVGLNTKASLLKEWDVKGLISVTTTANTTTSDLIPFSLVTDTNYIFDGESAHNNKGVVVSDDWFESTDTSVLPTRNEDGTINMHGLLVLTSNAAAGTGAKLDVTSDNAKSLYPEFKSDRVTYQIIDGANQTINLGDSLTVRSEADFAKFDYVSIDGIKLDAKDYTVESGSTIVTVNADYLKTLEMGNHVIVVGSTDGDATTSFVLNKTATNPDDNKEDAGNTDNKDNTGNTDNAGNTDNTTIPSDPKEEGEVAADKASVSNTVDTNTKTDASTVAADTTKTADASPIIPISILVLSSGMALLLLGKRSKELN